MTLNLIPGSSNAEVLAGSTFTATFIFYQDAAATTPFDLTTYTVTLYVGGIGNPQLTLTSGSGLTIASPSNGTVVAKLTPTQTTQLATGPNVTTVHYVVSLTDGSSDVSYPIVGDWGVQNP